MAGGRVAVVTGASSGIGEATARELARHGLALRAPRPPRRAARADRGEIGGEWEVCDVSDRAQVDEVAARVLERHPAIALLVNNAGVPARGSFLDIDPERIERVTAVNYLGGVWCLRAFAPGLRSRARTRTSSTSSPSPGPSRSRPPARTRRRSTRSSRSRARRPRCCGRRDPGAHGHAGLRRDRGLSAALEAPEPASCGAS